MTTEDAAPAEPTAESEREALARRRSAAGIDPAAPHIGLALSGGGIRSATFCLGLLRALAKNGVLHRFDYLSTVSGGGYIGSAWGRLFNGTPEGTPEAVTKGVAADGSVFLWWLRNNGRFLAPAGAADLLQAAASQLRGFIATHVEVAALATLLACVVTLPHLAYAWLIAGTGVMPVAMSVWWWLLPVPAATGLVICYGYWFLGRATWGGFATALLAGVIGVALAMHAVAAAASLETTLLGLGAIALLPTPLAWICSRITGLRNARAQDRVRYTAGLARSLRAGALIFALGLLDMASWYLREWLNARTFFGPAGGSMATGVGITTVLIGIVRLVLPALQGASKGSMAKLPWAAIANVLGLVLIVALALFWTTIFQTLVFPFEGLAPGESAIGSYLRWSGVALVGVLYLLFNGRSLAQLNESSLHYFYRSRIARAYVSVGNTAATPGAAHPRFPVSVVSANNRTVSGAIVKVTRLLDGDDPCMTDYAPHRHGGPIHLVNCCVNQTVDDRTDTYNADRKGVALTVSALGVETGTHGPAAGSQASLAGTTLAEWIAISGAALGSGMGSLTRPGVAALSFLSGLRLGYWQENLADSRAEKPAIVAKYTSLLREMFARFPGLGSPQWYLSDGGHFDNTGVYALLKRELQTIVLADCGADPDYLFADVENLIRKARIDYDAAIEFIDPGALGPAAGALASLFGTPSTVAPTPGNASLLLARVSYASGKRGCLLIVKPHLPPDMPLDVAGYADRDATFPQQSTANQFFSEAQWESYCELGVLLGMPVNADLLASVYEWAWLTPIIGTDAGQLSAPVTVPSRAQRIATTVGTSIGVGALLTGLLAGWQAWDAHSEQLAQAQAASAAEARRISQETTAVMTSVSAADLHGAPYNNEINGRLVTLTNDLQGRTLTSSQRDLMQNLWATVQSICDRTAQTTTEESELWSECQQQAGLVNTLGTVPLSEWTAAMRNYDRWRDAAENTVNAAASNAAASITAASPAPPPPMPEASPPAPPPPEPSPTTATVPASAPSRPVALPASPALPAVKPTLAVNTVNTVDAVALRKRVVDACGQTKQAFLLYTQIYDDRQRDEVMASLAPVRDLGIVVPGIENVSDTARRSGQRTPFEWRTPTVLYAPQGAACATALVAWANAALPALAKQPARAVALPPGSGQPNVLELWIPRPRASR
jgi:hypothetical protein